MSETTKYRVADFRPAQDEAIKPSELIQVSGHQTLSLNARRAITILWHRAHQQGIEEGRDYQIELSDLRTDAHKGNDVVEEAVLSLMKTILTVKLADGRTRRVQFLGGNDMDDPDRPAGVMTYSFDKRLVEILKDSAIWGRITIPVLMAFSSKYSVSLYENASQWLNLDHKSHEDFSLDEFRNTLGVEDGKYVAFGALNKHVIKPTVDEINALAPFNISVIPVKEGRKVARIRLAWWKKSDEEIQEAWRESQRPKFGRRARIKGRVEHVKPLPSLSKSARESRKELRNFTAGDVVED
mmetsp:Transcript_27251/g.49899  ORF Transcript_27251/g.49899 Transcript_27251/m.49899 type:complete len:297 (-) Transcript_27251:1414-2304(-)